MIRTALNAMIYVMLAKFIINDLPHAAGLLANPNYGVPPTPRQLRYVAVLCQQLKITTLHEEQVKTSGEAGRLIRELEEERRHRKRLKGGNPAGNPELPGVVVTEVEENITAHMPGIRATAELTRLSPSEAASFGLEANNWLWFNRLINQSGIPRVGTLLLDEVLKYCKEKNYSIVNQVNAYGAITQKELEDWYIRKGFTPVDYKKYGNALLRWGSRSGNPTVRVDTNEEISQNRVSGVAIAWVGGKDIGSLHYNLEINGTGEILFMQVDEEYRGLGVGKKMYQAVENLARGHGVKKLTSEVGIPGYGDIERAKRFWESVGFTVTNDSAEKQLKNSSPNTAVGTCYEDAWRFLIKQEEGHLIHGSVQLSAEGPRVNHAWVELPTGWVWEPQTGSYYTIEDFRIMNPAEEHRYTVEEAAIMAARTGKFGPWTGEERNMWL